MKLIKKIAAIMFAFMMVVSMSCNVKAVDTTTTTTETGDGKITINNAIPGQTYKIYKILELESYNPTTKNYAYKVTPEWKNFVDGDGNDYLKRVDGTDYVNWEGDSADNGEHVKEFAEKAIAYVKKVDSPVKMFTEQKAPTAAEGKNTSTVTFKNLPLGYYLVDSSVGTLCSLDTTKPESTIQEKNGVPSVEKGVSNSKTGPFDTSSTASIGDTVYFKTTITAQAGAKNYVLHDTMTNSLAYNNDVNVTYNGNGLNNPGDYTVTKPGADGCTFDVTFTESFLNTLPANAQIYVTYSATVNENAVVKDPMTNKTHLTYGDENTETNKPETTTKTFEMKVFKFYKDKNDSNAEKGLAGATFKLTKDSQNAVNIGFVKTSNETATDDVYRVAKKGETGTVTTITSPKSGKFTIQGLGAGTYYLTETQQPDGYNKLSSPVKVEIKDNGDIYVDGSTTVNTGDVKVENKSGTVLPSTGGAGTTMIYLVGAVLVLGSGVVLVTKRRVKNK